MKEDLRDKFALSVISELLKAETDNFKMLHGKSDHDIIFANAAKIAYQVADAMLYVRKIKN